MMFTAYKTQYALALRGEKKFFVFDYQGFEIMSLRLKFASQKYPPQEKFSFELDAQQGYAEKSKNGTICGV